MADIVAPDVRSRMMGGIRGKNTRPELLIRRKLFEKGFRYRLHVCDLPGKPDLVFPKHRAVIFVDGCFWHGHGCHLFRWPRSRKRFWRKKISGNRVVDERTRKALAKDGWRILTVWECAIKGRTRINIDVVSDRIEKWLHSCNKLKEITGKKQGRNGQK